MSLNPSPGAAPKVPAIVLVVAILVTAGAATAVASVAFEFRSEHGRVTVVDDLGRPVAAPTNASRIVVLAPSIMDLVHRLGLRDRVVGIGCTVGDVGGMLDEYSPNQTAAWDLNSSLCITDYPSLDTERIAFLDPGLVLATTITSTQDVNYVTATYGIPVVVLAPATLEGIVGDVSLLAQLFPAVSATATSLEVSLERTLYNATAFDTNLSNNGTPIPTVLLTEGFSPGGYYTFGPGTFGQSLIDLAGGDSLSAGLPLQYATLNATAVLVDQPQVILYGTSWNDPYLVYYQTPDVWNSTAPYWSQLNGTKIAIDVTLVTEPGPTMILALPWYLYYLHPSLVPRPGSPPP